MFSLSVPSKTFLIGEYGALNGGPALMLATPPRFVLKSALCLGTQCQRTGLEGKGPASVLLNDRAFNDYEFQFFDPHRGRGGLGASSAQYLLLHAFYNWLKFQPTRADRLLQMYRETVRSQIDVLPSGYDILSQFRGNISFIHWKWSIFETVEWPFPDLEIFVLRGPLKIATHEHLKSIHLKDTSDFEQIAQESMDAITAKDQDSFLKTINDFGALLQAKDLTVAESIAMQKTIREHKSVLAVKGCGALGADVLIAAVPMNESANFNSFLNTQKIEVISKLSQRTPGLKVDEMSHGELQSRYESEISYFREGSAHDLGHA
jgi:hypothetical protein